MIETRKSFCRFCHVFCGVEVDVEDDRVIAVRGDRENAASEGYTCPKGRAEPERIHHPDRILRPRKRDGDRWSELSPDDALDEIGAKLRAIIDEHGPESVAVYVGCGGASTSRATASSALRSRRTSSTSTTPTSRCSSPPTRLHRT
ncbi:MAG: molybdopterin-dependent oxidoreductase [Deltaproteobacteria bacterium]|nr:molybdopterin-dependent oxidoreductase [Deltaproteobacteria bacterium]